jgi:hypothetical protein
MTASIKDKKQHVHKIIEVPKPENTLMRFEFGYSSNVPDDDYSSNVPDEGYSSNVHDEGYSSNVPDEGYSSNLLE